MTIPKKHHIISVCLQKEWADAKGYVAVIDKAKSCWYRSLPKKQFRRKNLLTIKDFTGQQSAELEKFFGGVEGKVIEGVRRLNAGSADEHDRRDAAALCAVHFARSEVIKRLCQELSLKLVEEVVSSPNVRTKFRESYGRFPRLGEIEEIGREAGKLSTWSNVDYVRAVGSIYNSFLDAASGWHRQVVTIRPSPVSFVMADSPVYLSIQNWNEATSSDPIALGDADEVWFPTGPTSGIAFSVDPVPDIELSPLEAQKLNKRVLQHAESLLLASPGRGPHNAFGWSKRRLVEAPTRNGAN